MNALERWDLLSFQVKTHTNCVPFEIKANSAMGTLLMNEEKFEVGGGILAIYIVNLFRVWSWEICTRGKVTQPPLNLCVVHHA